MEPSVEYSSLCAAYSFPTSRPGLLTMEVRKLIVIIIISIIIISISIIIIVIIIIIKI